MFGVEPNDSKRLSRTIAGLLFGPVLGLLAVGAHGATTNPAALAEAVYRLGQLAGGKPLVGERPGLPALEGGQALPRLTGDAVLRVRRGGHGPDQTVVLDGSVASDGRSPEAANLHGVLPGPDPIRPRRVRPTDHEDAPSQRILPHH